MTAKTHDLASRIIESATDFAIISLNLNGQVTSWNPGAEQLLGWTSTETVGGAADLIFTPEDCAARIPEWEMATAASEGKALDERWHQRKDGSRLWGSGLMMPLRSTSGKIDGFTKIMRDRTAEREADQRYTALMLALPGFMFVTDARGRVTETNDEFRSYTGRGITEMDGDRWLEALHEDDREGAVAAWHRALHDGVPYHARHRFRSSEGAYRCFACRALPALDENGQVARWIGTCLDVEDDARARAAIERLNLSLEHKVNRGNEDLASAIESLQEEIDSRIHAEDALRQAQKMEAVGQLTGGVAHDFNNLLTVIRGSADLLRKGDLPEDRRQRYLAAIVDTAERAATLTSQLLAFARRQPLKPEVFDAADRLHGMEQLLLTTLGSRIVLSLDVHYEPCLVLADPNQFDTAVLNMAVNSRDAMEGTGELTIKLDRATAMPPIRTHERRNGSFVRVAVSDTGPGLSDEQAARVFEPFYTTKAVGKGTGLGLSQVHGFSKQSGGDIGVGRALGGGAIFTLYLPMAENDVTPAITPVTEPSVKIGDARGCILVVEDNETVGRFATDLLDELGYSTSWAHDAAAALERLARPDSRFDLVFSDIVMPGMSGIELAHRIRNDHPDLPVVLTSGYSHTLAEEGSHGFVVLQKPYSADNLARVLGRQLAT